MRTRMMWVAAACALAGTGLLGGCASAPNGASLSAAPDDGVDHQRVQAVERAARDRGVLVVWVNRPRKPS